jgi:beta-glucuronidase
MKYSTGRLIVFALIIFLITSVHVRAQSAMINADARKTISLDGDWQVIIDPAGAGDWRRIWEEKKPAKKTDFVEYAFTDASILHVPGDFNTQMTELTYEEGIVWYKKSFSYSRKNERRLFLHFGAVNYLADVYMNGKKLGSHEGGFTPFQFEISSDVKEGENSIVVKVNNQRLKNGLPALGFDWFNYGGITRSVQLIETANSFIEDYFIQLKKHSDTEVLGWIKINGNQGSQNIRIQIPELKVNYSTRSNPDGMAAVNFHAEFKLWSPEMPKIYHVILQSESDTVTDEIGFRNIEVSGTKILLNGKAIFLKGVNIHEEIPFKAARAFSEKDADTLLHWAKELGCNLVRLAHYPHNENMVKTAERMGLMVWDEIPVYQNVEFSDPSVPGKMDLMMREMIRRDRNRCGVIIWSLSNETSPSIPNRNHALTEIADHCRLLDSSRLITSVINSQHYENQTMNVWDSLYNKFDFMAVNEYLGWYVPWQGEPAQTKWKMAYQKPVVISEFGGEAKYGSKTGAPDEANSWREEYQEQIYKDQISMFGTTPNLAGVIAWILIDYRSPVRMQPVYQNGYNRKGLLSEKGEKKLAWRVLKKYYDSVDSLR